jgi:hypothetical protein
MGQLVAGLNAACVQRRAMAAKVGVDVKTSLRIVSLNAVSAERRGAPRPNQAQDAALLLEIGVDTGRRICLDTSVLDGERRAAERAAMCVCVKKGEEMKKSTA